MESARCARAARWPGRFAAEGARPRVLEAVHSAAPRAPLRRVARAGWRSAVGSALGPLALAALCACAERPQPARDLVLLSLDTLRADRLSCYGAARPTSPAIDALAARGVRFAAAEAPASQTAPSHMSLFTGLDPAAHGVVNVMASGQSLPVLSPAVRTLPEALSMAGFVCAALSDRGNLMPEMGFGRGFELSLFGVLDPEPRQKRLTELLGELDGDPRPLFLFLHAYLTHAPYLPPKPFYGRFHDPAYEGEFRRRYLALRGRPRSQTFQESGAFLETWPELAQADLDFLSDLYDEAVAFADRQVERWLDAIAAARGSREALIVLLSDHGEEFREHGRLGHRNSLHRELVHVPLILAGAGLSPRTIAEPFGLVDLPATLAELVGARGHGLSGRSVASELRTGAPLPAGAVHGQLRSVFRGDLLEAVRLGDWRLLREQRGGTLTHSLYDLASDPGEIEPRDEPARADQLQALLEERRVGNADLARRWPVGEARFADAAGRAELEALGYTLEQER
jgi:arylsulfatase A-like enzyme